MFYVKIPHNMWSDLLANTLLLVLLEWLGKIKETQLNEKQTKALVFGTQNKTII